MKFRAPKAAAIELLLSGITVSEVANMHKLGVATVIRWFLSYLGSCSKDGFVISLPKPFVPQKVERPKAIKFIVINLFHGAGGTRTGFTSAKDANDQE